MMLRSGLVRLIESHAEALASGLEEKVRDNVQVGHFRHIPADELREPVCEIYRHLGEWLLAKNAEKSRFTYPGPSTTFRPSSPKT